MTNLFNPIQQFVSLHPIAGVVAVLSQGGRMLSDQSLRFGPPLWFSNYEKISPPSELNEIPAHGRDCGRVARWRYA